jgi:hypothetical protein
MLLQEAYKREQRGRKSRDREEKKKEKAEGDNSRPGT